MNYKTNKEFIQSFQKLLKIFRVTEADVIKIIDKFTGIHIISTTYQRAEKILYGYTTKDNNIRMLQEELEKFKRCPEAFGYIFQRKSKDIIKIANGGSGISRDEMVEIAIEEKKKVFDSIENAITIIEKDQYFEIIELFYFQGKTDFDIARMLKHHPQKIRLQRDRLVKQLEWLWFWPEIIDNEMGKINYVENK